MVTSTGWLALKCRARSSRAAFRSAAAATRTTARCRAPPGTGRQAAALSTRTAHAATIRFTGREQFNMIPADFINGSGHDTAHRSPGGRPPRRRLLDAEALDLRRAGPHAPDERRP